MDASSENPYASPATTTENAEPLWLRRGKISFRLIAISIALIVFGFWMSAELDVSVPAQLCFCGAAMVGVGAFVFAVLSARHAAKCALPVSVGFMTLVGVSGVLGILMFGFGMLSSLLVNASFSRGRQLRRRGKVLLPKIAEKNFSWVTLQIDPEIPEGSRSELARAWRENGQTEHASVAAFARLTLDLMALGAPPDLIAASNQDALDEIRHAELCFSLARGIDGLEKSPAPFPEAARARTLSSFRKLAIAQLAVDSLLDGALHEGVSARVAAALAKKCESPQIKAVLKQIAADEGRHAAHGWDVVEWCVATGGVSTAHALLGAARMLPIEMHAPLHADAEDGSWEKFGITGRALEADAYPKTRANVMRRVETLVAQVN